MSFTRKFLKALGLEEEKIEEIMEAHVEVVDALKNERDTYKENADKYADTQKELDTLKNAGGDWQKKYEDEHSAFEAFKTAQKDQEDTAAKDRLYRELLKNTKVSEKRIDAIMKLTDVKALKLNDGKLDDIDALTETIKKDWADFIVTEGTEGAGTETPPGGSEGVQKHDVPLIF